MQPLTFILTFVILINITNAFPWSHHDDDDNNVEPQRKIIYPIILIPGLSGSKIEAKLNKTDTCFFDNFRLVYNETTNRTQGPEGVETRVPDFGGTSAIEYLSYYRFPKTSYFYNLVMKLGSHGYRRGKNLKGAPYDFRKAPYENEQYFEELKELIESTYKSNNDTPVIILCHSMGCLYSLYFFERQPIEWKEQYLRSFITVAAPFGGATESLLSILSGYNFDLPFYDVKEFRRMQQTFTSLTFLLPNPQVFGNTTILSHNGKNYTAYEIDDILTLANNTNLHKMWLNTRNSLSYEHPGIETHCVYGRDVNTHAVTVYDDESAFPDKPFIITGDGDGTVNTLSAAACETWRASSEMHGFNFTLTEFEGIRHPDMVKNKKVVDHIARIITSFK